MRGLVDRIETNPEDGTIKLQGKWAVSPRAAGADGRVALQVVDVTGLGLLLPSQMVQSALDASTTPLTQIYRVVSMQMDLQIDDEVAPAHYSTRHTSTCRARGEDVEAPGPLASQAYRPASMRGGRRARALTRP